MQTYTQPLLVRLSNVAAVAKLREHVVTIWLHKHLKLYFQVPPLVPPPEDPPLVPPPQVHPTVPPLVPPPEDPPLVPPPQVPQVPLMASQSVICRKHTCGLFKNDHVFSLANSMKVFIHECHAIKENRCY